MAQPCSSHQASKASRHLSCSWAMWTSIATDGTSQICRGDTAILSSLTSAVGSGLPLRGIAAGDVVSPVLEQRLIALLRLDTSAA